MQEYQRKDIIISILNKEEIFQYLHVELKERQPIYIVSNDFNEGIKELKLKSIAVHFVDSTFNAPHKVKLFFKEIECKNKMVIFVFESQIEGASVVGKVFYNGDENKWKTNSISNTEL